MLDLEFRPLESSYDSGWNWIVLIYRNCIRRKDMSYFADVDLSLQNFSEAFIIGANDAIQEYHNRVEEEVSNANL